MSFWGWQVHPFNHKIRLTAPSSPWIGTPALSLIIPWGYLSLMNYSIKKKVLLKSWKQINIVAKVCWKEDKN